ncbi:Hypothetical protein LUCI_0517 [Lucifera butyrica]|uniref:Uncharacterized protein n=1 Tax=Lucifera butyrica TaxID=1351585 RepID=A0A498R3D3_9FIRM|nr:CC/Se motif family (seleno)protein [Lucifera butyrica]VBB05310.1 Hypothetical protein LUCI_0517 [Lucifera butyrica]
MLTFTPEAVDFARNKNQAVYLDIPPVIEGCCITIRESPAVRFGEPRNPERFTRRVIQGLTVYVPDELPDIPLTIILSSFLGWKRLAVEGWRLA